MNALKLFPALLLALLLWASSLSAASVTDDAGQKLDFPSAPSRVVSLVPSATEIICSLGAGESLAGVTYHDEHLPCLAGLPIVGGAFSPHFDIINELRPDLLIVAPRDFETAKAGRGPHKYPILVFDDGASLAGARIRFGWLGQIFGRQAEAASFLAAADAELKTVADKVAKIKPEEKVRVMRLLYNRQNGLMTPGRESFQNEIIRAAGGLTPDFGPGSFRRVSLDEWRKYNPQVIFDCGSEREELLAFLQKEGWNEVEAVKNNRVYNFPCALTCRAAAHVGYFVSWLASTIYGQHFANEAELLKPNGVIGERELKIDLPYVKRARVVDERIDDFVHRALLIDFKRPQRIVSTWDGAREAVETIGNCYSPPPSWSVYHQRGGDGSSAVFEVLKLDPAKASLMFTAADMNNVSIQTAAYEDYQVTALVTAGVEGNALRTSRDVGAWYEKPGTINIMVLTNQKLGPRALTRALVTITEAKTAALWDMDIRSVQTPLENPATGTGTDTIIVVEGEGHELSSSTGHSKMGELIAEAVYAGVKEALLKQNGKAAQRHIFARLAERGLNFNSLLRGPDCPCVQEPTGDFEYELEALLLQPRYQGFVEAAFSLADASAMGQLKDLTALESWALALASEIAGEPVEALESIVSREDMPPALQTAFNALGTGLKYRQAAERPQAVNE